MLPTERIPYPCDDKARIFGHAYPIWEMGEIISAGCQEISATATVRGFGVSPAPAGRLRAIPLHRDQGEILFIVRIEVVDCLYRRSSITDDGQYL